LIPYPDHALPHPAEGHSAAAEAADFLDPAPAEVEGALAALMATGMKEFPALGAMVETGLWREVTSFGIARIDATPRKALKALAVVVDRLTDPELPDFLARLEAADIHPLSVALAAPWLRPKRKFNDGRGQLTSENEAQWAIGMAMRLGVELRLIGFIGKRDGRLTVDQDILDLPSSMRRLPSGLVVRGGTIGLPDGFHLDGTLSITGDSILLRPLPEGLRVGYKFLIRGNSKAILLPVGLQVKGSLRLTPAPDCLGVGPLPRGLQVGGDLEVKDVYWDGTVPPDATVRGKVITSGHPRGILFERHLAEVARNQRATAKAAPRD
jgi:hypothetical protein